MAKSRPSSAPPQSSSNGAPRSRRRVTTPRWRAVGALAAEAILVAGAAHCWRALRRQTSPRPRWKRLPAWHTPLPARRTTESDAACLAAVGGGHAVAATLSKKFLHDLAAMHHQSEMIDFRHRMGDYCDHLRAKLLDAEADEKEALALATGGSFRRLRPAPPPEDPLNVRSRAVNERKAALELRMRSLVTPVTPRDAEVEPGGELIEPEELIQREACTFVAEAMSAALAEFGSHAVPA